MSYTHGRASTLTVSVLQFGNHNASYVFCLETISKQRMQYGLPSTRGAPQKRNSLVFGSPKGYRQ
jgi:hypothetical protein